MLGQPTPTKNFHTMFSFSAEYGDDLAFPANAGHHPERFQELDQPTTCGLPEGPLLLQ